jgi:membrane associated rhomboid family serine protease
MIVSWMCVAEIVDHLLRQQKGLTFDALGIVPRTLPGLAGVLFSPLLHANFTHLAANAVPLLVLLTLLFWDRHYRPWPTLASIWIVSGLGTWLIGRGGSIHIGASSIIFGLVAYLIVGGLLVRSWRSAFVALLVLLAFGGIFYGVLPQTGPISWEGHLCGAVAGCAAAWSNRR